MGFALTIDAEKLNRHFGQYIVRTNTIETLFRHYEKQKFWRDLEFARLLSCELT